MLYVLPLSPATIPLNGEYGNTASFRNGATHAGVDFIAAIGTPLRAACDGVILTAGTSIELGNYIIWKGDDGYYWSYSHLAARSRVRGRVAAGEVIAVSGNSGRSTGPHVHVAVGTSPSIGVDTHDPMRHLKPTIAPAAIGPTLPLLNPQENTMRIIVPTGGYKKGKAIVVTDYTFDDTGIPAARVNALKKLGVPVKRVSAGEFVLIHDQIDRNVAALPAGVTRS